jgi:hypothetical protein
MGFKVQEDCFGPYVAPAEDNFVVIKRSWTSSDRSIVTMSKRL